MPVTGPDKLGSETVLTTLARRDTGIVTFILLLCLAVAGFVAPSIYLYTLTFAVAFALAAMGSDLSSGYVGLPNIGQTVFMAVGAYATTGLSQYQHVPFLLAMAAGALLSAILAAVIAAVTSRLGHIAFAIVTFMLAYVAYSTITSGYLDPLTKGAQGYTVSPPRILGIVDWTSEKQLYFSAVVILAVCAYFVHNYVGSAVGRQLVAVKTSEPVAQVLGINTYVVRMKAFAFSAVLAAIGGSLLAEATGYLTPDSFDPITAVLIFAMAAVGGLGTVSGAIIGALFFELVPHFAQSLQSYNQLLFGVLFGLVLVVFPGGIVSLFMGIGHRWLPSGTTRLGRAIQRASGVLEGQGVPWSRWMRSTRTRMREATVVADVARYVERSVTRVESGMNGDDDAGQAKTTALAVRGLSVKYGAVAALTDVNLTVLGGESHALLGPNGAGKTTLLNCLTGLVPGATGDVSIRGKAVKRLRPRALRRAGIGRTFQNPSLTPDLTAMENVMVAAEAQHIRAWYDGGLLPARFRRRSTEYAVRKAEYALDLVGFDQHRRAIGASDLSYGEQKVVDVARAVASDPDVLLLDEPSAGLSADELPLLANALRSLRARAQFTMVLVSHDVEFVLEACDAATVLVSGTVTASGTCRKVFEKPEVIESFLGAPV